ncbi:hypothetical protein [Aurantiacibacter hainanensis]|uniref:hypothetical protein n=1 Tax=Aurantiacibacter hainanensis TaxID=3076114 RepID=UPI0030C68A07
MARLRAACRPSGSGNAIGMGDDESGEYVLETRHGVRKGATLGSSINYHPRNA